MLLGVRDLVLEGVNVAGTVEEARVLHAEPERPMGVALAGCHLEHRLRTRRITECDAGAELGGHRVAHSRARAGNLCLDQRLRGFRQVGPRQVVGQVQPMVSRQAKQSC